LGTRHKQQKKKPPKARTERWLNPLPGAPRTAAPEPPDIG
jgi:hypothetical protein